MRVAIVHPWFLEYGGGERVLEILAAMYPNADIFTLIADKAYVPDSLRKRNLTASPLNKLLVLSRFGLRARPLLATSILPWATESLNLKGYDLVLSSCGPMLMGVNPDQNARHISYCHSPSRAWWDAYHDYQARMPPLVRGAFVMASSKARIWEFSAAQRVDHFVANSKYIANRIRKYYRRDADVIYPPVETARGYISERPGDYYLSVGRLFPTKRLDLLIQACNRLHRRLLIAGVGREEQRLKAMAGPTIEFLGRVPDAELPDLYANCRALLFAADEDFGMVPVEAQAYGRPVIAYGFGGSLETVRVGDLGGLPDTGVYFQEQTVTSLVDAIQEFEEKEGWFRPEDVRAHALQFDTRIFIDRMREYIEANF